MFLNFVEAVKEYFTPEFKQQLAAANGEEFAHISSLIDVLVPLSLAGMLHYTTSDDNNPEKFYNLTQSHMGDISSTPPIKNDPIIYERGKLIDTFFGKERYATLDGISVFSGVNPTTTLSSFYSIMPPILGLLGKHAEKNKLSENGLMGFLSSQRKYILKATPAPFEKLEILK